VGGGSSGPRLPQDLPLTQSSGGRRLLRDEDALLRAGTPIRRPASPLTLRRRMCPPPACRHPFELDSRCVRDVASRDSLTPGLDGLLTSVDQPSSRVAPVAQSHVARWAADCVDLRRDRPRHREHASTPRQTYGRFKAALRQGLRDAEPHGHAIAARRRFGPSVA
jgi:hypothetical protein